MTTLSRKTPHMPSEHLAQAFQHFDQAAIALQRTYAALNARVHQLDFELAEKHAALQRTYRETEEIRTHLTAILETLDTGIIVADEHEIITRCNKAVERLLRTSRDHLLGRPVSLALQSILARSHEYPVILDNGQALTVSETSLIGADGHSIGSLLLLHDVTRVRHLEERLQRRHRLVAMGRMIGHIAHEVRNPLGSIELFASLLRQDLVDTPPLRTYAEHISEAVQSLDRLLTNLLLYSRPDCSHADWSPIEPLITDTITLATHAIHRWATEITLDLDPLVTHIWCDASQIKQALLNLVLNGIEAMPQGGCLTISVGRDRGRHGECQGVRIQVRDTGIGIPVEVRTRIFDPFFTTREEGTGLGLAIVHAIVDGHGGRIDVESEPGQGTTLTLVLPFPISPAGSRQRVEERLDFVDGESTEGTASRPSSKETTE